MLITKHQKIDKENKTTKITHNCIFLETTVNNTLYCILVDFLCMNFLFFNTEMGIHNLLFSLKNIIERFASESQLSRGPRADHCHCPSILQSAPDNI